MFIWHSSNLLHIINIAYLRSLEEKQHIFTHGL